MLDLFDLLADLGYLGLVPDYDCPTASLDAALTNVQRIENTVHARCRVKVEHAIGGAKRLGCVAQTYRNKAASFNDRLLALACGTWNWHLVKQKEVR